MLAHSSSTSSWCNSERIERKHALSLWLTFSFIRCNSERIERSQSPHEHRHGDKMQLRKNWKCDTDPTPECRFCEMQLRKNWKVCKEKVKHLPKGAMQLRKNWKWILYFVFHSCFHLPPDATRKELKVRAFSPAPLARLVTMQLGKNWRVVLYLIELARGVS